MHSRQLAIAVAAAFGLATAAFAADNSQRAQRSPDSMSSPAQTDSARSIGASQGMGAQSQDSSAVRGAQQALHQKGYDVGPIDGVMGPKTSAALREFQQAQGLKASGRLDRQTLAALDVQSGAGGRTSSSDKTSPSPESTSSGATPRTGS